MKITIISVGKLKENFWKDACAEYLKRLGSFARVEIKEIQDIDPDKAGGVNASLKKEGSAILAALPKTGRVVLLDVKGAQRSSEELAELINEISVHGTSDITFIIGGSDGVSDEIRERADEHLSFGPITLPHNLARVVLLEQIYRAYKIIRGEPYHK